MRLLALLLLLAVLPTVELTEQAVHSIEHVLHAEAPDHSAHHDEHHDDEHGCTGLVHLCASHPAQVTVAALPAATSTVETLDTIITSDVPPPLFDLTSREPLHRPPIGRASITS